MAEGRIETNGVRLWYEEIGPATGPPVLLVMGAGASAIWWPPEVVERLVRAGFRVIRFDNRDIGLSTHVPADAPDYTLEDMVGDTLGLLDGVGIESAHLAGVSLGGMMIQALALQHPERARSLCLISSTPGPDDRLSRPAEQLLAFFETPADPDPIEQEVRIGRAFAGTRFPLDEVAYRKLLVADRTRGTNPNNKQGQALRRAPSRLEALERLRLPTLVVHGTEDPVFPYDHAEALARAIPSARLVPWKGVGHEMPQQLMPELGDLLVEHVRLAERTWHQRAKTRRG
jgi:pimeloyl-ACP methyl ester carboxylesterase